MKPRHHGDEQPLVSLPPQRRFINRDISWVAFNYRVLDEARNAAYPLLERLRFLSIAANNLDEFHMVQLAALLRRVEAGVELPLVDGLTPRETLKETRVEISAMQDAMQAVWADLQQSLRNEQVEVVAIASIEPDDMRALDEIFQREIFPLLTPMAISPAHPFPFIPNRGLAVVAQLSGSGSFLNAIIRLPQQLPRFVRIPGNTFRFVPIEDLIQASLSTLFPNYEVVGSGLIRVIRDSDLPIEDLEMEEDAEHLLMSFETVLQRSRHGEIVWLCMTQSVPSELVTLLTQELDVLPEDVDIQTKLIGLASLGELTRLDRPDLKFQAYAPRFPERIHDFGGDCFAAIRAKEILIHHPYETFDVVVQFIKQAASDPAVVAIKQTLYRTSENSPIVLALIEAAQAGKSVTAVVELKARFDEEANLKWARDLERAGVQVTYGFINLKIHAKLSLVIRREAEGLVSYIHYGTGNYHPVTARMYTDLSLFSCDMRLCADAGRLFNYMTGSAQPEPFERIAAAPLNLRGTLLDLIRAETALARQGRSTAIWFKVNGLIDPEIIEALYEASSAGVTINGIVRGMCALRAQVPGLSENISIHSIVGRFLEHARMVCFGNGYPLPSEHAKIFLSSADWMPRNFDRRIETLIPIETDTIRRQIMNQIMLANLNDDTHAWELLASDEWKRVKKGHKPFSAQDYFMSHPSFSGRGHPADAQFPSALRLHRR